jgi:diguanylate cyclase (GGDEF)-like protein/PAS domain S-box-containing protein
MGQPMLLRSVRSRLLGLVVATVVPFTALIGVGLWNQWQHDRGRAVEGAINQARLLAAQVDDHIGQLELLLTGLSRSVSPRASDIAANSILLESVKAELPPFVGNIAVFSLDGANLGSSGGPGLEHPSVTDRTYFRQVLAGERLAIGDVIRSRPAGRWAIDVARPVEDRAGRLLAVIVVGTWLEQFQDALRVQGLPAPAIVTITNEKGIVIARNVDGPSWIGRDVSSWKTYAYKSEVLEGGIISPWSHSGDREYITGFSTGHRVPWRVQVALPKALAFAPVATRLELSALFIFVSFMIVCGTAWMLSGRIVRPLQQLGRDAAILAGGNLSHRTTIQTADECRVLGDNFNSMALAIERRESELRKTKNTLSAVIDASPVAIACSDPDDRIILWNRAAEQIFGYAAPEMLGRRGMLIPPQKEAEAKTLFRLASTGETVRDVETTRRRKDGSLVDVKIALGPVYDLDGTVQGVARAYEDITERKRAENQLRRIAHYDQLTRLPNRVSLQKQLERLLTEKERSAPIALALLDLDGFKEVNDTFGHSTGDQLLIEVGQRLIAATEDGTDIEKVYRLGGDEFVILMPGGGDPCAIVELVDTALQRLAQPFQINDHVLHIGGSAGIAIAPNDGLCADELISNADLSLYQAKSAGGRVCRLFIPAFRAQTLAQRGLGLELRRAFEDNEFELYFQPQIRLADHAIVGAEALIRWHHPVRGIVAPGAFIETLAKSAIALDVGRWIIRTACQRATTWRSMGLPISRIGVNLFPAQAHDQALLIDVEDALRDSGLPPDALELEITENAAFNDGDPSPPLQRLHEMGVKLAFDDFGTGYASLNYLTRFPVSRIKIDRCFVAKITEDTSDATIVRSLIAMAHNLGLKVIAEGVETDAQAAFLSKEGCEEAQGFLYSKPLPSLEFERYLRILRVMASADGQAEGLIDLHGARRAQV